MLGLLAIGCGVSEVLQRWVKQGLVFATGGQLPWLVSHASVPVADPIGGDHYRVYFSARDEKNRSQIGYFEINLNNPSEILNLSDCPALQYGDLGTFDEAGASSSWLVNYQGKKHMYYFGWNLSVTVPFRNAIGVAASADGGVTFQKYASGPILDRSIHDPCFVANPCVLVEDGIWRMWYLSCISWEHINGAKKHFYHLKYSQSDDGIHWRQDGLVCIDFQSEDEYAIARPCVLKEDGIYKMWYSYRGQRYRIGYAESPDGLRWERMDEVVGLDVSETGWDSEMVEYAHVFSHKGVKHMFYNGNGYGETGIGYAILK